MRKSYASGEAFEMIVTRRFVLTLRNLSYKRAKMEFGRLESITGAALTLPVDHPMTAAVLGAKPAKRIPKIYIGCPVWADPGFVGSLYPKKTKSKDFLKLYAQQFNAVEMNKTGYKIPTVAEARNWADQVDDGFLFCPKVSQQIARAAPLGRDAAALERFYESMHSFGDNLGPVFLQVAPHFSPLKFDQLVAFITAWDKSIPLHIELRHPDWFAINAPLDDLFRVMKKYKIGTVITDVSGRRDVLHQCLTTRTAFVRFDGHDLHQMDFARLDEWAKRIKAWIDNGLQSLFFFLHTPQKHMNPYLANHLIRELNRVCGLSLKEAILES